VRENFHCDHSFHFSTSFLDALPTFSNLEEKKTIEKDREREIKRERERERKREKEKEKEK
jgi:hypothetical protein